MLAGDQLRQIFPLLQLVAVAADLVDAEVGMRAVGQADRGRRPRNLLDRDAMLEIAEAGSAIFLFHRDAMQAERSNFGPEVARELVAAVDLGGARRDLVLREGMHRLANRIRGFTQVEIEHSMRVGNHGPTTSGELNVV